MLFCLAPNTPKFEVFRLLNVELLHFIEQSVITNAFGRVLFTQSAIGDACWANTPTRDKYEVLFNALQGAGHHLKQQLFEVMRDNQDLQIFFENPQRNLFDFMSDSCRESLKSLCTHLYCATKDLVPIVIASGGINITDHFNGYRAQLVNGNICKACGMKELAPFRAAVTDGEQWRADYDHQLCKSKYPIFSVHPDNLIPLCDVCNQDAKKAKDLFRHKNGTDRLAFYPFTEDAQGLIEIEIENLRDPEPTINVNWNTQDGVLLDKLNTWDEVYEIRSRVEGQFRSLEAIIEDEVRPRDAAHLVGRIRDEARPSTADTLKRKEWKFWYQKLFSQLQQIGVPDVEAFWARQEFTQIQAEIGADFILNG
ncbi:hypothetical protein [Aliiglaciecola lipolytica]|uniref:Uncharacterized protein n=1 Tax=Aliiglaciecola lipolytica E3 TaxID=1127673 RepID=K6YED3_9ALTE|nr:hypothetical protein [Aliiglaciecola lipolytica]GAC16532.1 hypothetical protein GLIP_3921 [Aliiglaciecola lipolytica E3]